MTVPIIIAALTVLFMLGVGGWMTTDGAWYQSAELGFRARVDSNSRTCRLVGRVGLDARFIVR
jgi:hypothetical protein